MIPELTNLQIPDHQIHVPRPPTLESLLDDVEVLGLIEDGEMTGLTILCQGGQYGVLTNWKVGDLESWSVYDFDDGEVPDRVSLNVLPRSRWIEVLTFLGNSAVNKTLRDEIVRNTYVLGSFPANQFPPFFPDEWEEDLGRPVTLVQTLNQITEAERDLDLIILEGCKLQGISLVRRHGHPCLSSIWRVQTNPETDRKAWSLVDLPETFKEIEPEAWMSLLRRGAMIARFHVIKKETPEEETPEEETLTDSPYWIELIWSLVIGILLALLVLLIF